jgi:nicotinamide mononucleotide transporter
MSAPALAHALAVWDATRVMVVGTVEAVAFAPAFTVAGVATSWLELVAFVLALAMVLLNIRVNPWAWPLAIASSLLYLWLFWHHQLYGDGALQVFFALVAAWGWWQWLRGTGADGRPLQVSRLRARGRIGVVVCIAIAWPAVGLYLDRATDTDVPWWDAFPTAASVVGQWLLARKRVETWPVWIAVNGVATGLFAYKGLWLTAVLYAVFIGLSLAGWRAWLHLARDPGAQGA